MNPIATIGRLKKQFARRSCLGEIDSVVHVIARNKDFDRLRDLIRQSGTDNLFHFGNAYTHEGGLSLQQNPDEFASLICFLKEQNKVCGQFTNYMEIGSASGGTCLLLNQELKIENTFSLDDHSHPRALEQQVNFRNIPKLRQFVGDSHSPEAREFLSANLVGALDVAFIDGDHSYKGVLEDLNLTLEFCKPGTLIIFHDTIACDGVEKVWLDSVSAKKIKPLAEYTGKEKGLGIAVGKVI